MYSEKILHWCALYEGDDDDGNLISNRIDLCAECISTKEKKGLNVVSYDSERNGSCDTCGKEIREA